MITYHSLLRIYLLVFVIILGISLAVVYMAIHAAGSSGHEMETLAVFAEHISDLLEVAFGALIGALSATLHHSLNGKAPAAAPVAAQAAPMDGTPGDG